MTDFCFWTWFSCGDFFWNRIHLNLNLYLQNLFFTTNICLNCDNFFVYRYFCILFYNFLKISSIFRICVEVRYWFSCSWDIPKFIGGPTHSHNPPKLIKQQYMRRKIREEIPETYQQLSKRMRCPPIWGNQNASPPVVVYSSEVRQKPGY